MKDGKPQSPLPPLEMRQRWRQTRLTNSLVGGSCLFPFHDQCLFDPENIKVMPSRHFPACYSRSRVVPFCQSASQPASCSHSLTDILVKARAPGFWGRGKSSSPLAAALAINNSRFRSRSRTCFER